MKFSFNNLYHVYVKINRTKLIRTCFTEVKGKCKDKALPLQAWSGPEGSRKLRFPDFVTTAQDGGKVVSHTHRPLYPRKYSWCSFILEAELTPGP